MLAINKMDVDFRLPKYLALSFKRSLLLKAFIVQTASTTSPIA